MLRRNRFQTRALNCATSQDILKTIKDKNVEMVDLRFTDLPGVWQHFSVPPSAIIGKLNNEINAALTDRKLKLRLAYLGSRVARGWAADYGRRLEEEAEKWGKVIRAANIKAE